MDSYNHYLIARYSWKYPHLFVDQWGKPLYNIMASPFANLGFTWVKIFNVILWVSSAWLTFITSKKLGFKYAWVGFLLVIVQPASLEFVISGLTEFLNEFLLILFIYLTASQRWNMAAFLAGLLPFARSEGFIIMAVVGFYLLFIEKKYKSLFWFAAAPILFNFIGWFAVGDPLWIIHNPYIKAQVLGDNFCGSGSLFHYAKLSFSEFSLGMITLLLAGTILSAIHVFKGFKKRDFVSSFIFWLCSGIFWLYFLVHSVIWWKGMMGSCGYARVFIVVMPVMALTGVFGLNALISKFKTQRKIIESVVIILLIFSGVQSYNKIKRTLPSKITPEQREYLKVAQWLQTEDYSKSKMYFLYPYLNVIANIDPYNINAFDFLWSIDLDNAPPGSLVIWDSHFGPNEGKLPYDKINNHPGYTKVKTFAPVISFTTVHDIPYEIHIFRKDKDSLRK